MTKSDMIRGGGWFSPTPEQRAELELAKFAMRHRIQTLRRERAEREYEWLISGLADRRAQEDTLNRAAHKAEARRFTGEPPSAFGGLA